MKTMQKMPIRLAYDIQRKKSYLFDKGNMDTIHQRLSEGFILSKELDYFQLSLKMQVSSIVWIVEYCPINTKTVTFQLIDKQENIIEESIDIVDRPGERTVEFKACKIMKKPTYKIKMSVNQDQKKNGAGIKYLNIMGEKNYTKPFLKKNLAQKSDFFSNKGQLFEKKRIPKKMDAASPKRKKINTIADCNNEKYVHAIVNSTWLQEQQRKQDQQGVPDYEKLFNFIKIKPFKDKIVCIDMPSKEREALEKLAEEMGANVVKSVADNCLLVSNRNDTLMMMKSKKCKNVRLVTPRFIEECKKSYSYLNVADYLIDQ